MFGQKTAPFQRRLPRINASYFNLLGDGELPSAAVPADPQEQLTTHLLLDYLVELGTGLMSAGCPSYRLEELLVVLGRHEGFEVDAFAVPTGLFVSVKTPQGEAPAMSMVRVRDWRTDLETLALLDEVMNLVVDRKLTVREARARLKALHSRPATWPASVQVLGAFGASGGAAVSFGGSWSDFFLAGLGGVVLRGVTAVASNLSGGSFLDNFIGGAVAALVAWVSTLIWPAHSREILVLAIIIPLLPGMVVTTGLTELTSKNLVSGTARLMDAAVTLLSLVFGIALVVGFERWSGIQSAPAEPLTPAFWPFQVLALLAASASFGVLLGMPRKLLGLAMISGFIVWATTTLSLALPSAGASFIGALVLGLASNVYARVSKRPSQLFLLPGLLLLVPGAFGFRSLDALLRGDYASGASQAVDMVLIAGGLVMGLLVANIALPARKIL